MQELDPNIRITHKRVKVPSGYKHGYWYQRTPNDCQKIIGFQFVAEVDSDLWTPLVIADKPLHWSGAISFRTNCPSDIFFQAPVPIVNGLWECSYAPLGIDFPFGSPYKGGDMAGSGTRLDYVPVEVSTQSQGFWIYYEDHIMDVLGAGTTVYVHITTYYRNGS